VKPNNFESRLTLSVHLDNRGVLATIGDDVRRGLASTPKYLQPKYFYDAKGSILFEQITDLPEYYVARAEEEILLSSIGILMAQLDPAEIIEIGSGSSTKTRAFFNSHINTSLGMRYLPMDVSEAMLRESALELLRDYPFLEILGIVGDFERDLHHIPISSHRRLILFLGSTLGNLDLANRHTFLSNIRKLMNKNDRFLLGVDLVKDSNVLHAAYNDSRGITAQFNLNILNVINKSLDAHFDLGSFTHSAFFNSDASRIEMHLVSDKAQTIQINGLKMEIALSKGETIWTESSYKFTRSRLESEFKGANLHLEEWFTDPKDFFGLALVKGV
jgi:L-histidine N-alpha-methyltransferase